MTFEEFFIKKRIDLKRLRSAEPLLYNEFERHYALMGEKSFDHTKKFWFNPLRKRFHLEEEELPTKVKDTPISTSPLDENKAIAETEAPQATKPAGFKPRFKATANTEAPPAAKEENNSPDSNIGEAPALAPPPSGFKPRFKKTTAQDVEKTEAANPATADATQKAQGENDEAPTEKPLGFKPRFKAGVTNKDASTSPSDTVGSKEDEKTPQEEVSKPLGFKPRFKAGATDKPKMTDTPESAPQKETTTEEPKTDGPAKPLGFKPRFKASKPKSDDTGDTGSA